jgi:GNAT superfamily N-acetyltransferase
VQHRPPRRRGRLIVRAACEADLPAWLGLVREVEPLFGDMPDFEATLRRNMARRSAFAAASGEGEFLGGMLLGGPTPCDRWIRWLAVRSDRRGRGAGAALVERALALFPPPCSVSLHTFGEDNPGGLAARRLYLRYGFQPREMVEPGPEGGSRQLFVLERPRA